MMRWRALSVAVILSLCLLTAAAQKKVAVRLTAPTFYIAASAQYSGTDYIWVRGASNLPPGAHLIINVYDHVGQRILVLNDDTRVTIGKDGFFEPVKILPKPGAKFHENLTCEVVFSPTFPLPEASVLRAVGGNGEKLDSSGKNPQAMTVSGGYYLSEEIHVR